MNAGSFIKYINTPALLHQLPYEELKTIVLQYPYSANLHLLLLLKSKLDNHKDYEKNLAMAASHSINRSFLYKLLQNETLIAMEHQQMLHEDEVLELEDLASLEQKLQKEVILLEDEESSPEQQQNNVFEFEMPTPVTEGQEAVTDGQEAPVDAKSPGNKDISADEIKAPEDEELLSTMQALNAIIEDVIAHEEQSENISDDEIQEISSLTDTLKDFLPESKENKNDAKEDNIIAPQPVEEQQIIVPVPFEKQEGKDHEKPKKKPVAKKKVSEIASKSIKSQSRVASETLAQLLESQGLTDKAIKMYEQLILTFPEKSAYFAAKIENLKNLK